MSLAFYLALLSPLSSGMTGPDDSGLSYRITRMDGERPAIQIRVLFTGDGDGSTELSVAREWGGVTNGGEDLTALEVRAVSSATQRHAVTQLDEHRWSVQHAPGEALDLRYRIEANDYLANGDPSIHRRPIVTAALFHGIGDLFLIAPEHVDPEQPAAHSIEWSGFDASDGLACSFGVGPGPHRVEVSLDDLRHGIFLGGAVKLVSRDVMGSPLWIAVQDTDWRFEVEEFADLSAAVVDAERAFFEDFDRPFYLISMIAVGEAQPGSLSIGGTGLTQSFSLAVQPGFDLRPEAEGSGAAYEQILGLLTHELFHDWNGVLLRRVDPEPLCYWMSEGFTEFYSRRLQLRGGFIELEDYVESLNDSLRGLYTSPAREAENQRILDEFWTDAHIGKLPYRRGDVVAMLLDHALRAHSEGKHSLDDLMRELVDRGRGGWRISTDELLEIVAKKTSAEVAATIRGIVVDGRLPVLDPQTFAPCLILGEAEATEFDMGFDAEGSRAENVVQGVRPGGPAFAAGLRDGDVLTSWSYRMGEVQVPVVLQVQTATGVRDIRYAPKGATVSIPQFRLGDTTGSADCGRL